ncbi:MAG: hypothetical protein ACQEVA_16830 [Myxococcota bacterium]
MEKVVPKIVAVLGGLGLGSALAYFLGVYLAFQPGWGAWSTFFVPLALPLMLIPYLSLTAYLYLRSRLSEWLVERGEYALAIEYAGERLEPSLLRSKKETHMHRLALGRAHICQQNYEEAYAALSKGYAVPRSGARALEIHRWQIEAALRLEDMVRSHASYDRVADVTRPASSRVYILGCRIEMAVREKDHAACNRFVEEAEWLERACARVDLARALQLIVFEDDEESYERALGLLESSFDDAVEEVPGRQRGLLAWRARALTALGRLDEATLLLDQASESRGDRRSDYVVDEATAMIESVSKHQKEDHDG